MHILIIDDFPDFYHLLERLVSKVYPDASITVYDPSTRGHPGSDFPWKQYDLLFLDYRLGEFNGLEWLKEFQENPDFPPTIFLTGQGNEKIAVKALKMGADDYIRKGDLTLELLQSSIANAIDSKKHLHDSLSATANTKSDSLTKNGYTIPFTKHDIAQGNSQLGNYRIKALLGEGSTGMVYRAQDELTGIDVAIKFMDPLLVNNGHYLDRFIQEYQLLADTNHPHLIGIHEQSFTDDHAYIVMEYVSGGDLRISLQNEEISLTQIINYISQIASALAVLHEKDIIHRDIKPANILLREDSSPVLSDFGMAKRLDVDLELTRHGEFIGTPYYVSPEQVKNQPEDARSDLYSLGVMFYEMAAGHKPFSASTASAIMHKHANELPDTISDIPESVNAVIHKLLSKQPRQRYPDAKALQEALSSLSI